MKRQQAVTTMKCVWAQKVSLLIDGELDRAEAREVEQHLASCGDCREAQADFLSLRRQIADYQIELDAFARQRALKTILVGGAKREAVVDARAGSRRRGERFAGVFGMPRLSRVGLAALLLLLVGVAVGIVSLTTARRPPVEIAKAKPMPAPAAPNNSTASANNGGELAAGRDREAIAGRDPEETGEALATGASKPTTIKRGNERAPRIENARNKVKKSPASPRFDQPRVGVPVAETANNNGGAVDNGVSAIEASDASDELLTRRVRDVTNDSKTARHVEQAQLLLRSFRNARVADAGRRASSDLAYDKRQSKKLLYQNIVLRREAASRGNLPVESLLDSLEPILIDIANLPDKPAPADVKQISERMRRKNLVAMLQISSVESASARSY